MPLKWMFAKSCEIIFDNLLLKSHIGGLVPYFGM